MTPTRLVTEAALAHEPEPGVFTGRWDCSCGWHAEPADAQDWWRHVFAALPERPALDVRDVQTALQDERVAEWLGHGWHDEDDDGLLNRDRAEFATDLRDAIAAAYAAREKEERS